MTENKENGRQIDMAGAEAGQAEQEIPVDKLSDSAFYRMYLREVRTRTVVSDEAQQILYLRLLEGDRSVQTEIVDNWLMRIVELARFYKDTPVVMEDVIQEGNMGLWLALEQLPSDLKEEQVDSYLLNCVRDAMENYIWEITGEADREESVVAKAALLYSAREHLAKENGEVPSLRRLSEFTHISAEEIEDIFALMKNQEN